MEYHTYNGVLYCHRINRKTQEKYIILYQVKPHVTYLHLYCIDRGTCLNG